jgi:hypothetical protein
MRELAFLLILYLIKGKGEKKQRGTSSIFDHLFGVVGMIWICLDVNESCDSACDRKL